ncbi:hypothetical protein [Levilactobacillus namurensis]|uniref:hypothetical protein n=1 Tax=Levilactobacillus namurensis TaxID=380393 RepID=UPI0026F220EA|nr:hypothetical protein [Levilactobacillus namurensis]
MRKTNPNVYFGVLSKVLQGTEDEANDMNADFEKIRQALDAHTVDQLTVADLTAVANHFQKGTDGYQAKLAQLEQAQAPIKILGKHKNLVTAFRNYTEGCQAMTDSIHPADQTVDEAAFNAAEQQQEEAMGKVTAMTQRIMTSQM